MKSILLPLLCLSASSASGYFFTPLGHLPGTLSFDDSRSYDISGDGTTVVGTSNSQPFRWTLSGGYEVLSGLDSRAETTSRNGSRVFGDGLSSQDATFVWDEVSGASTLNGLAGDQRYTFYDTSADGRTLVGWERPNGPSRNGDGNAVMWTRESGITRLSDQINGPADAISDDGSVIVGVHANSSIYRWTADGGVQFLTIPEAEGYFFVDDTSSDASVIVGTAGSNFAPDGEAFRWSELGGLEYLGDLEGGVTKSFAYDVSGDGSIAVGYASSEAGREAVFWNADGELIVLEDFLFGKNVDIGDWERLLRINAISTDGSVVAGTGLRENGALEPFFARIVPIPEPGTLSVFSFGFAGILMWARRRRLN